MRNHSHRHKAIQSLQFLRGKAHALLEELFPNKAQRYGWLKRNAPKMHMSEAKREELNNIIAKLRALQDRADSAD